MSKANQILSIINEKRIYPVTRLDIFELRKLTKGTWGIIIDIPLDAPSVEDSTITAWIIDYFKSTYGVTGKVGVSEYLEDADAKEKIYIYELSNKDVSIALAKRAPLCLWKEYSDNGEPLPILEINGTKDFIPDIY